MAKKKRETKKVEKKVEEAPKKKKIWKKIVAIIILIAILIYVFFFLTFKVTFKYNNGEEDKVIKIKFLRKIPLSEVKQDLKKDGYTFAGYAETYFLNGEQIATIKNDSEKEKDICKPDFRLDSDKVKCISEYEFDFENTRIWKKTTIEALWSKEGKKIIKKEVIKKTETKDNGNISVSASNSCLVKDSSVTVTASVNNAKDGTIEWSSDSCLSISGSGSSVTVTANGCGSSATVTAKLKNGSSDSVTLTYEEPLSVTLVDYEGNSPYVSDGYYYGVKTIKTNIPAIITGTPYDPSDSPRTSAYSSPGADATVTIKTPCGQSKTYNFKAVIN